MNGAELLGAVKRRLPLSLRLMLSGFADLDSVLASVNEGEICRFIKKPWNDKELLDLLQGLLATFTAEVGGDQSLVVELPLLPAGPEKSQRS